MKRLILLLTALCALIAAPALAQPEFPAPTGRVADQANSLSPLALIKLNDNLAAIEATTGVDILVLTVGTLNGASEKDFCEAVLARWRTPSPTALHQVVLLLATQDRSFTVHLNIALGDVNYSQRPDAYWFERGTVPPSFVERIKTITNQAVVLPFRNEKWEEGILAAIDAIVNEVPAHDAPQLTTQDSSTS